MSQKEEELNQTIDFFKIENAKLCDQIIKMCHDLKNRDEKWNASSRLLLKKFANHFESKLLLIKKEIDKRSSLQTERQNNLLNMVDIFFFFFFLKSLTKT